MSKVNEELVLDADIDRVMSIVKQVAAELQWRVLNSDEYYLSIKEVAPKITSSTWPAAMEIFLSKSSKKTKIEISGSILGYGPIQKNHLKGQIGRFLNALQVSLSTEKAPSSSNGLSGEIEKLSKMLADGLIDEDEFKSAKKKLLS